jgi:hypothetical protein
MAISYDDIRANGVAAGVTVRYEGGVMSFAKVLKVRFDGQRYNSYRQQLLFTYLSS